MFFIYQDSKIIGPFKTEVEASEYGKNPSIIVYPGETPRKEYKLTFNEYEAALLRKVCEFITYSSAPNLDDILIKFKKAGMDKHTASEYFEGVKSTGDMLDPEINMVKGPKADEYKE